MLHRVEISFLLLLILAGCSAQTTTQVPTTTIPAPTPTVETLDISIVAGMGMDGQDAEVNESTISPTVEQMYSSGATVPADIQQGIADLSMAVSGQITGATEAVALWNEQYGDNARIQIYGKNSQGIIWAINPDGSFKEYPVQVADDPEKVFKFVEGQQFGLIPGSEKAAVVWSGEKLIVVRNEISLSSGGKAYLEYFDIWTREWKLNPNTLKAQLPADQQNLVPFQDADGQWLAAISVNAEPAFQWNTETNSWQKIETFDWDAAAVQMENYGNAIGGECIMPAEDLAANWHEVILILENQPFIPEGNKTFAMARTLDKDGNWIEVKVLLQEEENGVNKNRFAIVFLYGLNGDFLLETVIQRVRQYYQTKNCKN